MAVVFNKSTFSAQADWTFDDLGTFKSLTKGQKLAFTRKNLAGEKAVTVQIFPKKFATLSEAIQEDEVRSVSCTKPLSKVVRELLKKGATHAQVMGWLLTLNVQESQKNPEIKLLFMPQGEGTPLPVFTADALEEVSLDDFAAL